MRLSGFTCLAVIVAIFVAWVVVFRFAPNDHGENDNFALAISDPEVRLGVEAERRERLGRPRGLHAADNPSGTLTGDSIELRRRGNRHIASLIAASGAHPLVRVRPRHKVRVYTKPGGDLVAVVTARTEFGSPTVLSVVRTAGPWLAVSTPTTADNRLGWIRPDPESIEVGWTERSIHVDLSTRQAMVRVGNRRVRTFSVTTGADGTETPTGRFAVTDTFRGDLNPVYGCCALALSAIQTDLPPGWPGGNRIAIHGNGSGQPLGIAASNGCLRADDRHVDALVNEVELGTPVFIHD